MTTIYQGVVGEKKKQVATKREEFKLLTEFFVIIR